MAGRRATVCSPVPGRDTGAAAADLSRRGSQFTGPAMTAIAAREGMTLGTGQRGVTTCDMFSHSVGECGLLRTVHIRPAGGGITMTVGATNRKSCSVAASAVGSA